MNRTIRSLQRAQQRPDTAADIAARRRRRAACAQALEERLGKYPILTEANVDEAIRFQEARIRELLTN